MRSLFQNVRTGDLTRPALEHQLKKFQASKQELVRRLARRAIGRDLFDKEFGELQFNISILDVVLLMFDDLCMPLKIRQKPKTGEVEHGQSD